MALPEGHVGSPPPQGSAVDLDPGDIREPRSGLSQQWRCAGQSGWAGCDSGSEGFVRDVGVTAEEASPLKTWDLPASAVQVFSDQGSLK